MLGSAVNVYAPVDPGVLERASEGQDLVGGAEGVFGACAEKERAGSVGPVLGSGGRQAGMDRGESLERHPCAGELEHDTAAGAVADGAAPITVSTRQRK